METEDINLLKQGENRKIEIAIESLIAKEFPDYSHMVSVRYEGGSELHLDFIDAAAPYHEKVAEYVKKLILSL